MLEELDLSIPKLNKRSAPARDSQKERLHTKLIKESPKQSGALQITAVFNQYLPKWLARAIKTEQAGHSADSLDVIYRSLDRALKDGEAPQIDTLFWKLSPQNFSTDILLAMLIMTRPARDLIPSRIHFLNRSRAAIIERGDFEPGLFDGLD